MLLGNWKENLTFLLAVDNSPVLGKKPTRGLAHRRRLDVAEFWDWSGKPLPTTPRDANQHGWFYPAHGSQVAVIELTVDGELVPRFVAAKALTILRRRGVPIRY